MEESNKLPLKRVELSLTKFNEVAIPHHLDLLRQHRANIIKYEAAGQPGRVVREQTHARRVTSQLGALLHELAALRAQVREPERRRFDALTRRARDDTLKAIVDYLGVIEHSCRELGKAAQSQMSETSPLSINRARRSEQCSAGSAVSTDSVGVVAHVQRGAEGEGLGEGEPLIQLQIDEQEVELQSRAEVLRGWSALQRDVHALHDAWRLVHAAAQEQAGPVKSSAQSVEAAADNVQLARTDLASAERIRAGLYGCGGAVAGALAGGPLGLVLGAKVGAAALVAGSALGYWAARLLGRRRQDQLADPPEPLPVGDKDKDE